MENPVNPYDYELDDLTNRRLGQLRRQQNDLANRGHYLSLDDVIELNNLPECETDYEDHPYELSFH